MRKLWKEYGKPDVGVPEDGVQLAAEELVGESLDKFFQSCVYGTDELPLEAWFASVGIGYRLRPAKILTDMGAVPKTPEEVTAGPVSVLGARTSGNGGAAELISLYEGGAAQKAGLAAGDRIIAVDGLQVNEKSVHDAIAGVPAGSAVTLHAFRRDELMQFNLTATLAEADTCDLWMLDESEINDDTLRRRRDWLRQDG
jgi:predicted metalloprotease with PDZ domain